MDLEPSRMVIHSKWDVGLSGHRAHNTKVLELAFNFWKM